MWPFRRRSDDDFRSEIEAHIALETDRLIAEGVDPGDARHQAARTFGNVTATQERFHESRRWRWLDELSQDVRYAVRTLRRSPGFAAVAILTLAIGLGANTAIFSIVNAVLLRPLPYRDPGSLVLVDSTPLATIPPWTASAWRDRASSLSDFAGFRDPFAATLVEGGVSEQVDSADVSWTFFSFLGVPPAVGRDFTEADAVPGAPPVGILSHELWIGRFRGDPGVVGRAVTLSGEAVTIIGVAAATFRFPANATPLPGGLSLDAQPDVIRVANRDRSLNVIGRLSPGVTASSAAAQLLGLFKEQAAGEYTQSLADRLQLGVTPLQEALVGDVRQRLLLVMGAVGFVLLIVCANVANLLLARASTRQRELAVRSALGARKTRLARLVLTESVLLALAGSVAALLFTIWGGELARTILAGRLSHVGAIEMDWWVLGFNVAIAVMTGAVCGLASLPAATKVDLATVFSSTAAPHVTSRTMMRRALLSMEVAVTFVLVVGAALLVQTLWNLNRNVGFDADRVLTMRVAPTAQINSRDFRSNQTFLATFFTDLAERLGTLNGVVSAAAVTAVPFTPSGIGMGRMAVEGHPDRGQEGSLVPFAAVTPGYFRVMRIALTAGRDFTKDDGLGAQQVAIVNEAFRRQYAPGADLIGARAMSGDQDWTIVGVVDDVPDRSLRDEPTPLLFIPLQQMAAGRIVWGALRLVVRTQESDPRSLIPVMRREVWAIDPNIVIDEIATMDERVAASVRAERESTLALGLLAVIALVVAAVGVYGVAAYAMAQRTKEIGIRVALGAARRNVIGLVVSQTLWPTLIGIGAGLAGAFLTTRALTALLYGVTPLDATTFAAAALVLVAVALTATYLPAHRATRIDPLVTLRYE